MGEYYCVEYYNARGNLEMTTIPSCWYIHDKNEFRWPRTSDPSKVAGLVLDRSTPADNWKRFSEAKVLQKGFFFLSY